MRLYFKAATKSLKLLREFEHRVYIITGVKVRKGLTHTTTPSSYTCCQPLHISPYSILF